jgi:hypothetical protein
MKTITELRSQREKLQKAIGEYMQELSLWDNRMTSIERREEMLNDEANRDLKQARDEGYRAGIEDAWELARIICYHPSKGGMSVDDMNECFGYAWSSDIMRTCSAEEAKAKYDAWKAKKEDAVQIGDIIHTKRSDENMVVTGIAGSTPTYHAVNLSDGTLALLLRNEFIKTGRRYELPWIQECQS